MLRSKWNTVKNFLQSRLFGSLLIAALGFVLFAFAVSQAGGIQW